MQTKLRQILSFGKVIKWQNLSLASLLLISLASNVYAPPTYASSCDDVRFIFARGSGETLHDRSYIAWQSEIIQQLQDSTLRYSFYELGSTSQSGYQYPAVAVSGDFWGYVNLVGAAFSGGKAFAFGESVHQGMQELKNYIQNVSASCPNTKFILGGYSQGAMILSQSIPDIASSKILHVTTFGDPKLYLPEGNNRSGFWYKIPDACRGKNLSEYRTYVPDCRAYEGILGSQRPYQPDDYSGKINTWCNASDIMCSSGMSIDDHTAYISEDLYGDAGYVIYQKLQAAFPQKFTSPQNPIRHNLAFMIDATGSMKDVIDEYRPQIKELAAKVFAAGGNVALYIYRDGFDSKVPIYQLCDLTCSEQQFYNKLNSYTSSWGGDAYHESLLAALYRGLVDLDWQYGATKSMVIITDTGYYNVDYDQTTLNDVVQKSLAIDPVNMYVLAPEAQRDTYADLTSQTNGQFLAFGKESTQLVPQIFNRPVAKLRAQTYRGSIDDEFIFDASESFSQSGQLLSFDWDLNGDGEFELKNAGAIVSTTYAGLFDGFVQVRVNEADNFSTMSARVTVTTQQSPEKLTKITQLEADHDAGSAKIKFTTDAANVLLSLGDAPIGFVRIANGVGIFTINDITEDITVTLTPYSSTKVRGVSLSTDIPALTPTMPTPPEDNATPTLPATPGDTTTPEIPSLPTPITPTIPTEFTPSDTIESNAPFIPSVPDTSAYDPCLANSPILAARTQMPMISIFAFIDAEFWRTMVILCN